MSQIYSNSEECVAALLEIFKGASRYLIKQMKVKSFETVFYAQAESLRVPAALSAINVVLHCLFDPFWLKYVIQPQLMFLWCAIAVKTLHSQKPLFIQLQLYPSSFVLMYSTLLCQMSETQASFSQFFPKKVLESSCL